MGPARRVEDPCRIVSIEPGHQPPRTTPLDQRMDGADPWIVDDEIRARPATDQDTLTRRDHEHRAAAALEQDHLPGRGMQRREIGPSGGLRLVRAVHADPIPPKVVELWSRPLYSHGLIAARQPAHQSTDTMDRRPYTGLAFDHTSSHGPVARFHSRKSDERSPSTDPQVIFRSLAETWPPGDRDEPKPPRPSFRASGAVGFDAVGRACSADGWCGAPTDRHLKAGRGGSRDWSRGATRGRRLVWRP